MAAPSDLFDPRRQPRRPAGGMDARAAEGWECRPLKLIEISSTGIRATAEDRVAPGAVIRVRMPATGST
jgi:hypothetical protein